MTKQSALRFIIIAAGFLLGLGIVLIAMRNQRTSDTKNDLPEIQVQEETKEGIIDTKAALVSGYTSSVYFPTVAGLADPAVEDKINQQILETVQALVRDYDEHFDALQENIESQDRFLLGSTTPGGALSLRIRYEIEVPEQLPVLSIQFWRNWDLSMAHPANDIENLIFDLNTADLLELDDLFADLDHEVTLSYVPNPASDQNSPNPNDYFSTLVSTISKLPHVMITDDGLRVTFDYYALGGRPLGQPEFVIPWDELKPAINPEGPLAALLVE